MSLENYRISYTGNELYVFNFETQEEVNTGWPPVLEQYATGDYTIQGNPMAGYRGNPSNPPDIVMALNNPESGRPDRLTFDFETGNALSQTYTLPVGVYDATPLNALPDIPVTYDLTNNQGQVVTTLTQQPNAAGADILSYLYGA